MAHPWDVMMQLQFMQQMQQMQVAGGWIPQQFPSVVVPASSIPGISSPQCEDGFTRDEKRRRKDVEGEEIQKKLEETDSVERKEREDEERLKKLKEAEELGNRKKNEDKVEEIQRKFKEAEELASRKRKTDKDEEIQKKLKESDLVERKKREDEEKLRKLKESEELENRMRKKRDEIQKKSKLVEKGSKKEEEIHKKFKEAEVLQNRKKKEQEENEKEEMERKEQEREKEIKASEPKGKPAKVNDVKKKKADVENDVFEISDSSEFDLSDEEVRADKSPAKKFESFQSFIKSLDKKRNNDEDVSETAPQRILRSSNKTQSKNSGRGESSKRGRPLGSCNKGPSKASLVKELLHRGTGTIDEDSVNNEISSNLDFRPKKFVEAELKESIEATVIKCQTQWDDVIGLEEVKRVMMESIVLPLKRPDIFQGIRASPRGILLYGPPGTGKTMLAKCAASSGDFTFFNISSADVTSKWFGETSKKVSVLFELARKHSPSIIFMDEIDALLGCRSSDDHQGDRKLKTQLLVEIDGAIDKSDAEAQVIVIGATNRPFDLDEAAIRRFPKRLYVPLPDRIARRNIIKSLIETKVRNVICSYEYPRLADLTEGFSAKDILSLCQEAAMLPIRRLSEDEILTLPLDKIDAVSFNDFMYAFGSVHPSVSQESIDELLAWSKKK